MSQKLSTKLFDGIRSSFGNVIMAIKKFMDEYDIASTPSFVAFIIVVTAGMAINYFFLQPKVGFLEALAISLLFEIGILMWKLQSHRVKNSDAQAEVVNWAMWLSVFWAAGMLVASLTSRIDWRWMVAGAALTHVIAYLLFDQNDDIRNNKRRNRQASERLSQKNFIVQSAIQEAEADLKIIKKITEELTRLRNENRSLPVKELEFVLDTTRDRLLQEYKASENVRQATKSIADVDGDGLIAGQHPS